MLTEGADPSKAGIKLPPSEKGAPGVQWVPTSASKLPGVPQREAQSRGPANGRPLDNNTMTLPGVHQSKVIKGPPVGDHRNLRNVGTNDNNVLRNKRPREEGRRENDVIDVDKIEGSLPPTFNLTSVSLLLALTCGVTDDGPLSPIKRQRTLVQPSAKHTALAREVKTRGISPTRHQDLFGDHFTSNDEMLQEFRSASAATQFTTKSPYFDAPQPQKTLPTPGQKDRPIQLAWLILPDGKKVEKLGIFFGNGTLGFVSFRGEERSIRSEDVGEVQVRGKTPSPPSPQFKVTVLTFCVGTVCSEW